MADVTVPYNLGESFLDFCCSFCDEIVTGVCLFVRGMLLGPVWSTVDRASGGCVALEYWCGRMIQGLGGWVHEADGWGLTEFGVDGV